MSFDFLRDAFKSLNEASFEINDKEALQDLDDFRKASEETEETTVSVIDPEADKEEELADSYIGKAICECPVCHSYIFKNKEDIRCEEGEDLCNTDEECPYCCEIGGFKIVGQVCEFKPGEAEEEEEVEEKEEEPEVEETEEVEAEEAVDEALTPKKLDPDKFTADEKNDEQVLVEEDDRNAPKNLDPDKFTADEKNKEQNIVEDAVVNSKRILSGFDGTDEDLSKFISECLGEGCWEELSFDDNDPDSLIEIYKDGELIGKFQIVDDKLYNVDTNECFSPKKEGILGMGLAGLAAGAGFAAGKKAFEGKEECADGECEEEKKDEGILGTLATAGLAGAAAGAASSFVNNKLNSGVSKDDELAEDVQVNVTDDNGTETVVTDGETVMSNDAVEVKATEDSIVVTPKENAPAEAEAEAEEKAPEEGEEIIAPIEPADLEPAEGEAEEAPAEAEEKPEEEAEEKAEEEVPAEEEEKEEEAKPEEEEADVAVEEIDNESFDRIGTNYLTNLYENVEDFKTINAYINENNSLVLEGVINFKSGKSATTSFIFEAKDITASGKARFVGMNESICKGKRAFTLTGTLKDGQYIAESLSYNYTAKTPSGRSVKVNGTVNK